MAINDNWWRVFSGNTTWAPQNLTVCNCVGGPDCCVKRAQRERDEAMRAEGRREVEDIIRRIVREVIEEYRPALERLAD